MWTDTPHARPRPTRRAEVRPARTTSQTVPTRVGPLNVTVAGAGDKPVALLWHSLFVDSRSWAGVVPRLATERLLVLLDGPGHGVSGDPGRRYTLHDCAGAASEVLDAIGVTGAVDWVGNAWGGHVGVVYATSWPERCRSLALFGTPIAALSRSERAQTQLLLALYRVLGPLGPIVRATTEALLSERTRSSNPGAVELVAGCLRGADRRRLRNAIVSISLNRPDLSDRLPRLTQPTLIVTGADHDGFTPDQARAAAGLVPQGQLAVLPDASYLVPLEAPAASADLLRSFWRTLGARR